MKYKPSVLLHCNSRMADVCDGCRMKHTKLHLITFPTLLTLLQLLYVVYINCSPHKSRCEAVNGCLFIKVGEYSEKSYYRYTSFRM